MIFIGEVVDCMGHLVCCEYAGTRHQSWSVAGSFGVCVGGREICDDNYMTAEGMGPMTGH